MTLCLSFQFSTPPKRNDAGVDKALHVAIYLLSLLPKWQIYIPTPTPGQADGFKGDGKIRFPPQQLNSTRTRSVG